MDIEKINKFHELRTKWMLGNRWETSDLSIKNSLNDIVLDNELIPLIVLPTFGTKLLQAMETLTKDQNESIISMLQTCLCESGLGYVRFGESKFDIEHGTKEDSDYFNVVLDGLCYDGTFFNVWFDNLGSGGW